MTLFQTLQTFSEASSLILYLQQLSARNAPHMFSLASLGVAQPKVTEVKETKAAKGKVTVRTFPKKISPLETPHSEGTM